MVGIEDFSSEILKAMEEYDEEVDNIMQNEIDKLSKELVKELKNHPKIPKKTGEYVKSFAIKKEAQGMGYKRNRIYNKKYQLTHLLENGHLNRDGTTRSEEYPHWKDAQEKADKLNERIAGRISNDTTRTG